ncbi:hypothetical protein GCM10027168_52670 [Streptomyces capparidis]
MTATALRTRLDAFEDLLRLSEERVEREALDPARELLRRAGERMRLSARHTVVALAGTTGSGKSSLFNAVCGLDLAVVGARRPTTSTPVACVWDPEGAQELLDRLGVPERMRFTRRRSLDTARLGGEEEPRGLVLLDLPDLDSADHRHRAQVDRMVGLVDVLVWVVDPEKYADASVHERYLRPLAGHAEVMVVVLNQIDRLPEDAVPQCTHDLRRLLDEDGLAVEEHGEAGAQVFATSALTGEGVGELRAALERMVRERGAADRRISADLDRAARELRPVYVGGLLPGLDEEARERFCERLAEAVGARAAAEAKERAFVRLAATAFAPPYARFLARTPVRFLGRSLVCSTVAAAGDGGEQPSDEPVPAHRAVVDEAVREVVRDAAAGLPEPWARGVREVAERGGRELAGALDEAVAGARSDAPERPRWWRGAEAVQWLLLCLAALGLMGLLGRAARVLAWPWWMPGALLVGAMVTGVVLGWLGRCLAGGPARRRGREVESRLREAAEERGAALVLDPLDGELRRYRRVRERYGEAAGA